MWSKDKRESEGKYLKESEGKYFEETTPSVTPEVRRVNNLNPARGEAVKIGRSIFIKGEVSGEQDLIIDGSVEGKIQLNGNQITVGESGKIFGEIHAKSITIQGQVVGNVFAGERLEVKSSGSLKGDITSPRVVIDDGARFKGSVDMQEGTPKEFERPAAETLELLKNEGSISIS